MANHYETFDVGQSYFLLYNIRIIYFPIDRAVNKSVLTIIMLVTPNVWIIQYKEL